MDDACIGEASADWIDLSSICSLGLTQTFRLGFLRLGSILVFAGGLFLCAGTRILSKFARSRIGAEIVSVVLIIDFPPVDFELDKCLSRR